MSWLDYSSKYLSALKTTTDSEREILKLNCASAISFVERFCNRSFAQAEATKVYVANLDGSCILDNPPISHVLRVCRSESGGMVIENTIAEVANFGVSDTQLILFSIASGVRATNALTLATYPTLTALAAAVTALGNGWTASAVTFGAYPSADLVTRQQGSCTNTSTLHIWRDATGSYPCTEAGVLTGLSRGEKVKITFVGGFADVPEDLKRATANLVIQSVAGPEGRVAWKTQGEFRIADLDKLPMSDRAIITQYRDRVV